MLSAVAEQAARKRAELGDTPKRQINQKMYLVKWAGLGYEFCTWETAEDLGRPDLIAQYHKLNDSSPSEPDMPEEEVIKVLTTTEHINLRNAGGTSCIPNLRTQLYAQTRAFEFAKFGLEVPSNVCHECGPMTKSSHAFAVETQNGKSVHPREVLECMNELVHRVAVGETVPRLKTNKTLPPLMPGEYDAIIPVTSKGLMMNVGEINGSVAFLGYRQFPDGSKGPAEIKRVIRGVGDKIIAVDGVSTVNKSFHEVIGLLRESGTNSYAIMRFIEHRYAAVVNETCSAGNQGRYAVEEVKKKFSFDRKRLLVQRNMKLLMDEVEEKKEEDDDMSVEPPNSDEEDDGSEGSFQPDSDEEPLDNPQENNNDAGESSQNNLVPKQSEEHTKEEHTKEEVTKEEVTKEEEVESSPVAPKDSNDIVDPQSQKTESIESSLVIRPETTKSLAFRLLHVDIGYSSDEGGDEDCAHFIDGVDDTFTSQSDLIETLATKNVSIAEEATVPVKRNEFSALGDRSKLVASVAVTSKPPDLDDFDENFPFPSAKAIAEQEAAAAAAQNQVITASSPDKQTKRSTVKLEQISVETGEIVNVWANVESAAGTLQLSLNDLKRVLRGEYDEDFSEEVGGFRWQYATADAIVTAGESKRSKKGKDSWLEFRDKLYDPNEPHIYKNNNRLRDYQVEGVNWLASTFYRKSGCILADEMGLGKVRILSRLWICLSLS